MATIKMIRLSTIAACVYGIAQDIALMVRVWKKRRRFSKLQSGKS